MFLAGGKRYELLLFVMVGCEEFFAEAYSAFIPVLLVMAGGCKLLDKDANYIAGEQVWGKL